MDGPLTYWAAVWLAAWLGLLTAISPCPLASNLAALSFVARQRGGAWSTALSGLAYALGRTLSYTLLAYLLVKGLLSVPGLSLKLEAWGSKLLGPGLVLMGLLMLEIIPLKIPGLSDSSLPERLAARGGVLASLALGAALALAFCPVSAGIYFGNLLPLATAQQSPLALPAVYGLATGLPVALLGLVVAWSTGAAGKVFRAAAAFERWARRITAWVFLGAGVYLAWRAFFPS
jgi:cytochrome c biogenesis protein CcdA